MNVFRAISGRIAAVVACLAVLLLGHGHTPHTLDHQISVAAAKVLAADICIDDEHADATVECEACRIAQSMAACPRTGGLTRVQRPTLRQSDVVISTAVPPAARTSDPARAPPTLV